ncbi:hypothetical protein [Jeotgalibacillus marinus]|uniref:Uncharacterized protein n=1 Tax=Jeotgalibacillus marinus TaxID=86667 RepID=A0ABV3Q665_9BACL
MILFLSMIIYYLIPTNEEDSTQRPVLPRENWIIQNDENPIIEIDEKTTDYSIPELDYLDYIDPSLERGSWTFPYEKESIRIDMGYSDTGSWTVVTGRKNENDGEIDVTLYSEPYTVGNIDISDDIDFLNVDIGKDELYLYHPTEIELKYATYKKPFVYTQFRGGGFEDLDIRKPYYGLQVVYLEIPKDLELTTTLDQSIEIIEN